MKKEILLGEGQCAKVVKVDNVAIKKFFSNYDNARKEEVFFLNKLDHENIVKMIENDFLTITMELCDGDLLHWIKNNSRFIVAQNIINVANQLVSGTKYLSNNNIVHADLKLANILYKKEGIDLKIKICDFSHSFAMDSPYHIKGSVDVIPPEAYYDKFSLSNIEKYDIWSIGQIIYGCFTRKHLIEEIINTIRLDEKINLNLHQDYEYACEFVKTQLHQGYIDDKVIAILNDEKYAIYEIEGCDFLPKITKFIYACSRIKRKDRFDHDSLHKILNEDSYEFPISFRKISYEIGKEFKSSEENEVSFQ